MEIILCLHNIRSTYNVGAILRTAEGLGIEEVICSGYTPSPLNPNLLPHLAGKIERQIAKTALGAEKLVPIRWTDDLRKLLKRYKEDGYQIIGLENRIDDGRKYTLGSGTLISRLREKAVLILGEEVQGIDRELYDDVDIFIEIPMVGKKESFNVSVAAGIALYALKTAF
ncbi:TrmH family RNA methyltransferase [Candidatus Saccharibacteria bacterium]|nr:TrmH family RNA methyltransferase [Candidatus Saccharibacteria bacterium]MBR5408754.1 TrmH family RNA methyltransferase [Candidatus Saccharibacteria bacterium]